MPDKPKILNRHLLAESRLFTIEALDLEFSNGEKRVYERIGRTSGGAVLIIPMLDDKTVLLIKEYAAGTERYELGLPKGRTEPNENSLGAANRELMEEVGYGAKKLDYLTSLTIAPGYLEHSTDIILARDLYEERREGDEPEPLEVVPWPLGKIHELIKRNDFSEARSLAALFLAQEFIHNDHT
jgi:ADP-ribose diphosphatase